MPARTTICLFFLLLGLGNYDLLAQQKGFTHYSVSEGLPQSKVTALFQDSRGFLWIGTQSAGIARFDGRQFVSYSRHDGLLGNQIFCFAEDPSGRLWIGTQAGISLFDGESFTDLLVEGNKKRNITALLPKDDGAMWVGTQSGAYIYANDSWQKVDPANTFRIGQVNRFLTKKNGDVWLGHSKGLLKIAGKEIKQYSSKDGLNSVNIQDIAVDKTGNIWIGSILGGVQRFDGEKFVEQFVGSSVHEGFIQRLFFDLDNKLWIGGKNEGLSFIQPGQSHVYSFRTGLPSKNITAIFQDSWGNIWIGSLGGGISKYHDQKFIHYGTAQGLAAREVYAFEKDGIGDMWIGNGDRGIGVFNGLGFERYDAKNKFADIRVPAIHRDQENRMWLGTQGRGLAVFEDTSFRFFSYADTFQVRNILDILEDKQGALWLASKYRGIHKITPYADSMGLQIRTESFSTQTGLISNNISSLHLDKKGRIWYGSRDAGLGYIEADGTAGVLGSSLLESYTVSSLSEDSKGYLWIGTQQAGVHDVYLYGKKFTSRSHTATFQTTEINFLRTDSKDRLWVGSPAGLDHISLDFERNFVEIRHYGHSEGLRDIETHPHAVYLDTDGSLWIGANSGFSIYRPNSSLDAPIPPRMYLKGIKLYYESLQSYPQYQDVLNSWGQLLKSPDFEADDNHLIFEFMGVDLGQSGRLDFQYRIKELNKKWSPPFAKQEASFHLPSGNFTFEAKAINGEDVESEILRIPFKINTPFYLKTEFIATAIALGMLLIWLVFRLRLNQVRKIARIDQEKLQIEKDLVQLEQKALRLQMNPHFLFNALNSIQGLITEADTQKARYYLAKFSKLMRLVLENSRESMIPLSDEIETLEHYLTVEQFSSGEKFTYTLTTDSQLDPEFVLIPPMMIQPFIENAIIHGVTHLDQKGEIHIDFRKIGKRIECSITDNGVGRQKAAEIKSQQAHKHKSTALLVTQERLDILSKGADWGKSIEIVDLTDARGTATGTKVILRLPLILDV